MYEDEECLVNGCPDTKKADLIFYNIDNGYWSLGSHMGEGFHAGKQRRSE